MRLCVVQPHSWSALIFAPTSNNDDGPVILARRDGRVARSQLQDDEPPVLAKS